MPKMEFRSNAKPSTYAYPPPLEEKKEKEREKVTTAVLSITAKARKKEVEKKEREEKMEVVSKILLGIYFLDFMHFMFIKWCIIKIQRLEIKYLNGGFYN